jgi:hypothetical protein
MGFLGLKVSVYIAKGEYYIVKTLSFMLEYQQISGGGDINDLSEN